MTPEDAQRIADEALLTPDDETVYDDLCWILDDQPASVQFSRVPVLLRLLTESLTAQILHAPAVNRAALLLVLREEVAEAFASLLTAQCTLAGVHVEEPDV